MGEHTYTTDPAGTAVSNPHPATAAPAGTKTTAALDLAPGVPAAVEPSPPAASPRRSVAGRAPRLKPSVLA